MEKKISIYRNIFDTTSTYTILVTDALMRIKSGRSARAIISLRAEGDAERQRNMKDNLPSVTFSGTFSQRNDEGLIEHSGFICLDFDDVDTHEYKQKMAALPYCFAAWDSPRGNGTKALIRIANGKKHKEHFAALQKHFPECDSKCANPSRVCYESYDENIYINENAKAFTECIKYEVVNTSKPISIQSHEQMAKLSKWCEAKGGFYKGNRNQSAFILAGAFCRFGIYQEESANYIISNYSNASEDFTAKEIERAVASAYKKNKNNFGTAEFNNENLVAKETKYEISPDILIEGYKLEDIVYAADVYEQAADIYVSGYKSAETTFIPKLDHHFKWKRGEITLLTGIGNYGKSSYLNYLMVTRALLAGNKWAVFSPENNPAAEYYFDLTEILLGSPCDAGFRNRPSRKKFDEAYEFISKHFYYIYPETIMPTPEYIKTKFLELIIKEGVSGIVIDPFNQMMNDYAHTGGRDDRYIETFLSDIQRFAQENNVFCVIVAHPHKLKKDGHLNYPCPDVFELAGGAMWNNKCDNILVYHRPKAQEDPTNPLCEHHSKKIRRQKMVGLKGVFEFEMNYKRRRFYFDGFSPLDGNRFESSENMQTEFKIDPNPTPERITDPRPIHEYDNDEPLPF